VPEPTPEQRGAQVPLASDVPIVVFGDDWGRHVSTMQHLFRRISTHNTVVWVNAIGHRVPSLNRQDVGRVVQKIRAVARRAPSVESAPGATPVTPDLPTSSESRPQRIIQPRVLPWHNLAPVRAFNTSSLTRAIGAALRDLGTTKAPLLVTGTPPSAPVLGRLGEVGSIYLCMDDFLHLPGVSSWMLAPLERALLARVDATVATAQALVESKRPRSGRSHYLPQGVNYTHFATPQSVPADLAGLPRPYIGFAGGIAKPVDQGVLLRLADDHPRASIVLVGPVSVDVSALQRPNIHLLGARPYATLPAYVQAFDVGLIPYVLNEHTIAVDPLKLLEYLAAGIPVVTTDLPEVRKYQHAVRIGASHDAFAAGVGAALAEPPDRGRLRDVAREHDWSVRADQLAEIMGSVRRAAEA
jgi:glycosyltransferase involved in cell wall biosynthesis